MVRFFGALLIKLMNFIDDFLFSSKSAEIHHLQSFVDRLLHLLGWTLSLKDNQFGEKVKFLGFLIDSVKRKFSIPQSKCDKTIAVIDTVCRKSSNDEKLLVLDLQRLTGSLISFKLAIPSISVWIREVYFCLPKEDECR
jgi:hypothetical protein